MSTRVTAPGRLHFGLFHVPAGEPGGTPVRQFGGLGLMVERPVVRVEVRRSEVWTGRGSLGERALGYARRVWETRPDVRDRAAAFEVAADGPPEHVGLGVGTALGMAVAAAVLREAGLSTPGAPADLARLVGRGARSGVGMYGFARGGLIADGGKADPGELPRLEERLAFPGDWRVVLLHPGGTARWYGEREVAAFRRPRPADAAAAVTCRLHEAAFGRLIPAVWAADFAGFATAVHDFNRTAGEPFAEDQGGPYAGPAVAELVAELRSWGVVGVGQSSWGPTVFAFAADADEAAALAARACDRMPGKAAVTITAANNMGAAVEPSDGERRGDADQPDQEDVGSENE